MNWNGPTAPRHDPCEVTSGVTMRLQGPHHSAPQAWPAHGRTRDVTPPASSPAAPARSSAGKFPGCEAHSIATAPNVTARCGVEGPHFVTKAPDDGDQPRHLPTRTHGWLWQAVGSGRKIDSRTDRTIASVTLHTHPPPTRFSLHPIPPLSLLPISSRLHTRPRNHLSTHRLSAR